MVRVLLPSPPRSLPAWMPACLLHACPRMSVCVPHLGSAVCSRMASTLDRCGSTDSSWPRSCDAIHTHRQAGRSACMGGWGGPPFIHACTQAEPGDLSL